MNKRIKTIGQRCFKSYIKFLLIGSNGGSMLACIDNNWLNKGISLITNGHERSIITTYNFSVWVPPYFITFVHGTYLNREVFVQFWFQNSRILTLSLFNSLKPSQGLVKLDNKSSLRNNRKRKYPVSWNDHLFEGALERAIIWAMHQTMTRHRKF